MKPITVEITHTLYRNDYITYIGVNATSIYEYSEYVDSAITDEKDCIETYSPASKMLQNCVLSSYKDLDATLRLVLNEYTYTFRPFVSERFFTVIIIFESKHQYNKMKLTHPHVYDKIVGVGY